MRPGSGRTILIVAPMPALPASAGNRRRLVSTCEMLGRAGYTLHFAYWAHEDQVYRRSGDHPPTDHSGMLAMFDRVFQIDPQTSIPLRTRSQNFEIDDWSSPALDRFVGWYFANHAETFAIVLNYVFLSSCLAATPDDVLKIIDTHDRFADRHLMYKPFGTPPSFFYTSQAGEALGLGRADVVLAIQAREAAYFSECVDATVLTLPPRFERRAPFVAPTRIRRIGFIGHGNDANLLSIQAFARLWSAGHETGFPELVIAGEIGRGLALSSSQGVQILGPVENVEAFYDTVDVVVAPMLMGTGLKMKVAEALSHGRPVIGTAVAFDGFDARTSAHRLPSLEAVRDAVLSLRTDAAGLAQLAQDCEALFASFDAEAQNAEHDLHRLLDAHPAQKHGMMERDAPPDRVAQGVYRQGSLIIHCEHSFDSLPDHRMGDGVLVATQRLSEAAASGQGYGARRWRWFARPANANDATVEGAPPDAPFLRGPLSLAPDWLRRQVLDRGCREDLALSLRDCDPDWTSQGIVVGQSSGRLDIAAYLPSFWLQGPHPNAVFLLDRDRRASELRSWNMTALASLPVLPHSNSGRLELTLVPGAVAFDTDDGDLDRLGRIDAQTLIVIHPDCIGRIDLDS